MNTVTKLVPSAPVPSFPGDEISKCTRIESETLCTHRQDRQGGVSHVQNAQYSGNQCLSLITSILSEINPWHATYTKYTVPEYSISHNHQQAKQITDGVNERTITEENIRQ